MPNVVDTGLQEGWLKKIRRNPTKPETAALYLIEVPVVASVPNPGSPSNPVRPDATHFAAPPEPGGNPPAAATAETQVGAPTGLASVQPPTPKAKKHQNTATQFEAVLSKSRIGSMPETRELVFDAVREVFDSLNGTTILINELFTRAIVVAKNKATTNNYTSELNWPVAERCIRRLMVWAGVLIGKDSSPIVDTIGINASHVFDLDSDFRRVCEAFLVQHIIEKTGGISFDDHPYYLGLTLYRRGRARAVSAEELKAKADAILVFLVENGRIEMDGERMIRVKVSNKLLSIA